MEKVWRLQKIGYIFAEKRNMNLDLKFKYMKIKVLTILLTCCAAFGLAELSYNTMNAPLSVEQKIAYEQSVYESAYDTMEQQKREEQEKKKKIVQFQRQ